MRDVKSMPRTTTGLREGKAPSSVQSVRYMFFFSVHGRLYVRVLPLFALCIVLP